MARHTGTDLLNAAAACGRHATPRLLRDWVELGLLDHPKRRGLGRGRGVVATWSTNQRELFLDLLDLRAAGFAIANMCGLPVWAWLRLGDDYVPLPQVRRAMQTWAARRDHTSWSDSGKIASEVVRSVAHPSARRGVLTQLRVAIAAGQFEGRFVADEFLPAARYAMDPARTRAPRGPRDVPVTPAAIARLVETRVRARDRLAAMPDAAYLQAREVYRFGVSDYAVRQPFFAAAADLGALFKPHDPEDQVRTACLDLLTLMGAFTEAESHAQGSSAAAPSD